ncbi:MAG: hypothetical protein JO040_01775 [Gemmatimonadetes bacterium]|nr:hypothetical protein [Gemmatimonadota bacterium]
MIVSLAKEFRLASIGVANGLAEMTIAARGLAFPLITATEALNGLAMQMTTAGETFATLTTTVGETEQAIASLEKTMVDMRGPALLQESLAGLETEAEFTRDGIDNLLSPALANLLPIMGRIYNAVGVLATGATRFGYAVGQILETIGNTAKDALTSLESAASGLMGLAGIGGAAGNAGEKPDPIAGALASPWAGVVSGIFPWGGLGKDALAALYQTLSQPEREAREREAQHAQALQQLHARVAVLPESQTATELRSLRARQPQLDRARDDLMARAEREKETVITEVDGGGGRYTHTRDMPTPETARALLDADWAAKQNRVNVEFHNERLQIIARARQHTEDALGPLRATQDMLGGQVTGWGTAADQAAFARPSTGGGLRDEFAAAMNLVRDLEYRSRENRDPEADLPQLRSILENARGKALSGNGEERRVYQAIQMMVERALVAFGPKPATTSADAGAQTPATPETAPPLQETPADTGTASDGGTAPRGFLQTITEFRRTAVAAIGNLAKNGWGRANDIAGQQVQSSGSAFAGLLANFTPLGMVATLLEGVLQGLAPLIDSLKEPLRIVGTILGKALAPILKALFPIFKGIAIAATWVGQIFFTIAGGILRAIGALIKGLGKAIDKIPGLGDFGLKKAGQDLIDMGNGFKDSAQALKEGREEIKKLEFGDTADKVEKLNEQLTNAPEGFKVALARFEAVAPETARVPSPPTDRGGTTASGETGASESGPVHIGNVQIVSNNPEEIWKQLKRVMERENFRSTGSLLTPALV